MRVLFFFFYIQRVVLWFCFIHDEPIDPLLDLIKIQLINYDFPLIVIKQMFLCGVEIKEDTQLMCENRSDLN